MIRYILVDDNLKTLERVKSKIDRISQAYDLQHIKSYSNSKIAFEEAIHEDFDLLIVDFEMPVYNGLELAQEIGINKKIIFLTSTSDNEKKVINNLNITGYLSKPFDVEEFKTILKNKIIGKLHKDSTTSLNTPITLEVGANKDIRFLPEQVYYISTSKNINGDKPKKNSVHFYGKEDELVHKNIRTTIDYLNKKLSPYDFQKINQSTIINNSHFKMRDNNNVELFNTKETFEVTHKEKNSFISKLRNKLKF